MNEPTHSPLEPDAIISHEIEYRDGEARCLGFVAYPNTQTMPLACVLVVHDWGGRSKAFCDKAIQLAEAGYIGFAVDMYGNAKLGHNNVENRALMTPFREDRQKLVDRISAAFNAAAQLDVVNPEKIAAIGYCFGGLCVLDLARSATDIRGVVSFHGVLSASSLFNDHMVLNAKILVLHGYDDPLVLPEEVQQFAIEMTQKQADWQVHMYGLTAHSFTNPLANDDELGLHYNPAADKRSWASTMLFLQEIFSL